MFNGIIKFFVSKRFPWSRDYRVVYREGKKIKETDKKFRHEEDAIREADKLNKKNNERD